MEFLDVPHDMYKEGGGQTPYEDLKYGIQYIYILFRELIVQ